MEISATVADIKALLGEKVAEVIPIDAKLDAEIKLGTQHGIFASSANPEIIAFQPTHILSPGSLGSSASTEPEFVPFDPGNPLHREMLKSMGELIQP